MLPLVPSPFTSALEFIALGVSEEPSLIFTQALMAIRAEVRAARAIPEYAKKADVILVALDELERPAKTTRQRLQKSLALMSDSDPDIYFLQTQFAAPHPTYA